MYIKITLLSIFYLPTHLKKRVNQKYINKAVLRTRRKNSKLQNMSKHDFFSIVKNALTTRINHFYVSMLKI